MDLKTVVELATNKMLGLFDEAGMAARDVFKALKELDGLEAIPDFGLQISDDELKLDLTDSLMKAGVLYRSTSTEGYTALAARFSEEDGAERPTVFIEKNDNIITINNSGELVTAEDNGLAVLIDLQEFAAKLNGENDDDDDAGG